MSDMVFNELSIEPLARAKTEGFKRVTKFIETFKCGTQHGFNRIRFEDSFDQILLYPEYTLNDFCNEQRTLGILLRGLARYPFIDDGSEEEKRYIKNRFAIIRNGGKLSCYGLAAAYLYTTLGIGFASDDRCHRPSGPGQRGPVDRGQCGPGSSPRWSSPPGRNPLSSMN